MSPFFYQLFYTFTLSFFNNINSLKSHFPIISVSHSSLGHQPESKINIFKGVVSCIEMMTLVNDADPYFMFWLKSRLALYVSTNDFLVFLSPVVAYKIWCYFYQCSGPEIENKKRSFSCQKPLLKFSSHNFFKERN